MLVTAAEVENEDGRTTTSAMPATDHADRPVKATKLASRAVDHTGGDARADPAADVTGATADGAAMALDAQQHQQQYQQQEEDEEAEHARGGEDVVMVEDDDERDSQDGDDDDEEDQEEEFAEEDMLEIDQGNIIPTRTRGLKLDFANGVAATTGAPAAGVNGKQDGTVLMMMDDDEDDEDDEDVVF